MKYNIYSINNSEQLIKLIIINKLKKKIKNIIFNYYFKMGKKYLTNNSEIEDEDNGLTIKLENRDNKFERL